MKRAIVLFRNCTLCGRLVLVGMFDWINPRPPPIHCGDCVHWLQQAEDTYRLLMLRRLAASIRAVVYGRQDPEGEVVCQRES